MASKEKSIEDNFESLEKTIEKLSGDELSLEEAFKVYAEGMKLIKDSKDKLDKIEKKVLEIKEDGKLGALDE